MLRAAKGVSSLRLDIHEFSFVEEKIVRNENLGKYTAVNSSFNSKGVVEIFRMLNTGIAMIAKSASVPCEGCTLHTPQGVYVFTSVAKH
ncbi:hypothetical protein CJF30_00000664 [Rutstroemia sp. NJR-2017a BBW]|nr:hypothetical protein CJF30_00000664 [Rutstroemia sp. NJR-2017a BBW]